MFHSYMAGVPPEALIGPTSTQGGVIIINVSHIMHSVEHLSSIQHLSVSHPFH